MIVHDFSLPVKQVRNYSYYFCIMLLLVNPQIETSVHFSFNLRLHIIPGVTKIIF